ncbi:hypothetical protein [Paenibacillus sp.]|uniref:hypothetical protein n=1 Tax=Paenibacillus sp. TaxID=58172 RepID=UPI002D3C1EB8|nr:hypothetical protein [Paenibacillus sp.]HZG57066.1 hypothetical protein [Paenibacillus sp.]
MNRKVLTLACVACLSASMLTACGGQANDDGNLRQNNVNGYSQTQNRNGMGTNNMNGNGYGNTGVNDAGDVGSNSVGISGSPNGPRAANGGANR